MLDGRGGNKRWLQAVDWDQEALSASATEAWVDTLYEDGMAALAFCLTGNDNRKYYHKVCVSRMTLCQA